MKKGGQLMKMAIAVILVAFAYTALPAVAQETTGTPGSPGATTTIDGRYLPNPPQPGMLDLNLQTKVKHSRFPS